MSRETKMALHKIDKPGVGGSNPSWLTNKIKSRDKKVSTLLLCAMLITVYNKNCVAECPPHRKCKIFLEFYFMFFANTLSKVIKEILGYFSFNSGCKVSHFLNSSCIVDFIISPLISGLSLYSSRMIIS